MRIDKDSQHWKLSVFYFNPDDSHLFATKMTGLAFPFLNFAKPMAWVIAGLAIAIVMAAAIVNNAHIIR